VPKNKAPNWAILEGAYRSNPRLEDGRGETDCPKGEQHCGERPNWVSRTPANAGTRKYRQVRSGARQRSVGGSGWSTSEAGLRSDAWATVIGLGCIDDYSSCGYAAKSVRLMIVVYDKKDPPHRCTR
jgi:hypothetical protein